MPERKTIKSQFECDHASRSGNLATVRECAALTKPPALPPEGQTEDAKLPETYQSIGPRGITNLEGKFTLTVYPPGLPWMSLVPSAEIKYDPNADFTKLSEFETQLYFLGFMIQAAIEAEDLGNTRRYGATTSFRSHKRRVFSQILVTGEALEYMSDEFRFKCFRRDQYVTKRNSSGDVLYHIIREEIDPLELSDEKILMAGLELAKLKEQPASERMQAIFTRVQWDPRGDNGKGEWLIEQELNDQIIVTSREPVSPYFCTVYELTTPENYGRGFVEANRGDLKSRDTLGLRELQFAALASDHKFALDHGSPTKETELAKPSGAVVRMRVSAGVIQDGAFLRTDKAGDFSICAAAIARLDKSLGAAMLLESELQPRGERVTAFQVDRIRQEVDAATGGALAMIDDGQRAMIQRAIHVLKKKKRIPLRLDDRAYKAELLTGLSALSRQVQASNLDALIQRIATMGPDMVSRLNLDVLATVLLRYSGVSEPGVVMSPEQFKAKIAEAMKAQAQMAATEKTIDVVGNVAETVATQQAANAA